MADCFPLVDVAVNIFAKPYQTALSVLSLLKFSGPRIDRVYLQFEPSGSMYDEALPYVIADYLGERAVVWQPLYWLGIQAHEPDRLADPAYRLSIRYQHAFEHTAKQHLFIMHNDVLIKGDIIAAMQAGIGDAFVMGQLGQCWNCPASHAGPVADCGLGGEPCRSERYYDFRPDPEQLRCLYRAAGQRGIFARAYMNCGHDEPYTENAWPLPECRVNEWAALVNVPLTRPLVVPHGTIPPFGAMGSCGRGTLDTSVPWFRELSRLGLRARHMDIEPYVTHWVGTGKMEEYKYRRGEGNARAILERHFPEFVAWCLERKNKMFV